MAAGEKNQGMAREEGAVDGTALKESAGDRAGGRRGTPEAGFVEERRAKILEDLSRAGMLRVSQIAETYGVSRVTARADLDALERDGKLRRTHGGAVALGKALTVSVQDRRVNVNAQAKQAIARQAAQLVHDGDSVLLDSGTTALELVRNLAGKSGVTVVTNDFTIADYVDASLPDVNVIVLGGQLFKGHRYTSGPITLAALSVLHPDTAFVCPTSFVPGAGLMTNNQSMAEVKKAYLSCATHTYVLMDASKVGSRGLLRFGRLTEADAVYMDYDPDGQVAEALEGSATRLILTGGREAGD